MAIADSTASQATSLKRLTIIAIVFQPLSLASLFLAMTQSVQEIGELWFDWLGLWLTMGFVVALVYSVWKSKDHLIARPIAGELISEPLQAVKNFVFPWPIPFFCIIVVSFWIGRLDSLHKVPEALKWGFVALASLVVSRLLWYILPYIFLLLWIGLRKSHGKRPIYYLLMGCEICLNLKRFGGTIWDMITFIQVLICFFGLPDFIGDMYWPRIVELHGLVEKILKAAARSKRTKRFIQDDMAFLRQIVEKADQMEDRKVREMLQEIRSIAATDNQVQELLAGII